MKRLNYLKQLDWFKDLPPFDLINFNERVSEIKYKRFDKVYEFDAPARSFYIVVGGVL
jgi:hypothetical protein